jgi:hypothetical protein
VGTCDGHGLHCATVPVSGTDKRKGHQVNSQYKSAEEWIGIYKAERRQFLDGKLSDDKRRYKWLNGDLLKKVQANTMREAAKIAVNRMSPMTIPDEFIDRVEKAILDAAIAFEKGEYKPV